MAKDLDRLRGNQLKPTSDTLAPLFTPKKRKTKNRESGLKNPPSLISLCHQRDFPSSRRPSRLTNSARRPCGSDPSAPFDRFFASL